MKAIFTRRFSAAHRLPDDPSPCQRVHGHNYVVQIEIQTDGVGDMVVPAEWVKSHVDGVFDHKLVLHEKDPLVTYIPLEWVREWIQLLPCVPTTENLAIYIAKEMLGMAEVYGIDNHNPSPTKIGVRVSVQETPTITAVTYQETRL